MQDILRGTNGMSKPSSSSRPSPSRGTSGRKSETKRNINDTNVESGVKGSAIQQPKVSHVAMYKNHYSGLEVRIATKS